MTVHCHTADTDSLRTLFIVDFILLQYKYTCHNWGYSIGGIYRPDAGGRETCLEVYINAVLTSWAPVCVHNFGSNQYFLILFFVN